MTNLEVTDCICGHPQEEHGSSGACEGFVDDETACGDPDHCSPWASCPCACYEQDES